MSRNPNIIKFFRYAKLGENAGYGIDKMLAWERLTKGKVDFTSDLVSSTITYWFGEQPREQVREQAMEQPGDQVSEQPSEQVSEQAGDGYVLRAYPEKPNHPNQRYYLSEKGLKLVK